MSFTLEMYFAIYEVMPVFNAIVQFEISSEQAELLKKWNSYISNFGSFKINPIPVEVIFYADF